MFAVGSPPPRPSARDYPALLALAQAAPGPWYEVSDLAEQAGSAQALIEGSHEFDDPHDRALADRLHDQVTEAMVDQWEATLTRTVSHAPDTRLLTVLDEDYPVNLRTTFNRPPFIFVRGTIDAADARAVAVVGTRQASPEGRRQARALAADLAARRVTVVSGLAAGIDTEAHAAALDAGGRTVAVMGTGIDRVYPAANEGLAQRISQHGALVSQFFPGTPPSRWNFPLRNVVTSGIALGTVVVEASHTSGARMQARFALEHGKWLFLIRELVMHEEWARRYAQRPGTRVVESAQDVIKILDSELATVTELSLF